MQVKELSAEGLKSSYQVTIPASEINAQVEIELKAAGEKVKMPGFRPGFIPMKVLQQRYGKQVRDDVLRRLVNDATTKVIRDNKLRPALSPDLKVDEYKEEGDLHFTLTVESLPPVPDIDFSKISVERLAFDVDEAQIDEAAGKFSKRFPSLSPKSGKAEKGDVVVIDFKGMIDDVAFEGGTAEGYRLELGSGQFIEGFEEQLIGAAAGDARKVKVRFPDDYHQKQLAGRDAVFEVKVQEVNIVGFPAVDDEFAKARGFSDLRALREALRDQIIRDYGALVRNRMKRELFDHLEETYEFEVPKGMFDMEFNNIWARLQQAKASGDPQFEDRSEDDMREEYSRIAERRVRLGILLSDVASKNNVSIAPEELTNALMQYASMYPGQEKQVITFYRQNPERLDDLRGPILEEKAVDVMLTKIKVNERKVTTEELLKITQEDEDALAGRGGEKKAANSKRKAAKAKAEGEGDDGGDKPKSSKKKSASA